MYSIYSRYINIEVPKGIILDYRSLFTSKFQAKVCYQIQVTRRLSTIFYLQTNRQTERQNQTLEYYLRVFYNNKQDNQALLLLSVEFSFNNSIYSSIKVASFKALYRINIRFPRMPKDVYYKREALLGIAYIEHIRDVRATLKKHLRSI